MKSEFRDKAILVTVLAIIGASSIVFYFVLRTIMFLDNRYDPVDRIFASLLLLCDIFFFIHSIGFSINVVRSSHCYWNNFQGQHYFLTVTHPKVAILIVAYNENPVTLESTISICTLMGYKNKKIYLLDDSINLERKSTALGLAEKYGIEYRHRAIRSGFKAGAINNVLNELDAKYVMVLDADQRPSYNFLNEIVPILEAHPELAFVQTPQSYINSNINIVAKGAHFQQKIFYSYICEGKSVVNAIFSCGTNIVMSVSALRDIGGFDMESLTEDMATSFNLHRKGYKSYYYSQTFIVGEGPLSIPGYYKQQMRWAYGTLTILKKVLWSLIHEPKTMTISQWEEYLLAGTWYFVGWAYFFLMICPIAFLLFDIRPFIATDLGAYVLSYVPYFIFSFLQVFLSMHFRGYTARQILIGSLMTFLSFHIFMKAAIYAILGRKISFMVTPKVYEDRTHISYFYPHLGMIVLLSAAIIVGFVKLFNQFETSLLFNIIWCIIFLLLMQAFRYFQENSSEVSIYYHDIFASK